MIQPDPEILGVHRKSEYDDVIIQIAQHPEGDIFISTAMMEFYERTDPTPAEIDMYLELAEDAQNKFNFAIIFQNFIKGSFWSCKETLEDSGVDHNDLQTELQSGFMSKYMYIIDWLWNKIKRYKIWAPIKFIGSLIVSVLSKKRD